MSNEMSDEQQTKRILLDDIMKKIYDIKYAKEAFLRKYGWDNICEFPDYCWRWVKETKGVTIACSLNDAFDMESNIIEYKTEGANQWQSTGLKTVQARVRESPAADAETKTQAVAVVAVPAEVRGAVKAGEGTGNSMRVRFKVSDWFKPHLEGYLQSLKTRK